MQYTWYTWDNGQHSGHCTSWALHLGGDGEVLGQSVKSAGVKIKMITEERSETQGLGSLGGGRAATSQAFLAPHNWV